MIEEFDRIVDRYLKDHSRFTSLGETPSLEMITSTSSLPVKYVVDNLKVKRVICGFSRKFLEAKAWVLQKENNWKSFNADLALLIYGVFLFPNIDNFVELPIIKIFLTKDLVSMLLVDVYYYHHVKHEK